MSKNRKRFMDILYTLLLFYIGLVTFLFFYQRNLMYFPETQRVNPATIDGTAGVELIEVQTVDGLKLEGWFFPSQDQKPVMLWFHGNASSHGHRTYRTLDYRAAGYGVLLAGYRGYGGNPGNPSEEGLYKDARAYIKWAKARGHKIVLYGESLGSGVTVQMATEFDVEALILEAPYTSTVDIARRTYFYIPLDLLMKDQYRNIDKIAQIDAPLLIVHGEEDRTIPVTLGQTLFEKAKEPKTIKIMPNTDHNDMYERGAQLHVLEFLRNISGQ